MTSRRPRSREPRSTTSPASWSGSGHARATAHSGRTDHLQALNPGVYWVRGAVQVATTTQPTLRTFTPRAFRAADDIGASSERGGSGVQPPLCRVRCLPRRYRQHSRFCRPHPPQEMKRTLSAARSGEKATPPRRMFFAHPLPLAPGPAYLGEVGRVAAQHDGPDKPAPPVPHGIRILGSACRQR